MRIVFMGTPAFSATILEEIANAFDVVGVFTRPDAVRNRGKKLEPSPVKELALSLDIPVFTPTTLKEADSLRVIKELKPDVICVAAYGAILPKEVLNIPAHGCLNVHASILPRWRGAAPIQHAILAGDKEIGVCIMRMEEGLDTGDYCIVRRVDTQGKDAAYLTDELANLGARALVSALAQLDSGSVMWVKQDEANATYAHKIEKGQLDLSADISAEQNLCRVLASDDAHPARCTVADKPVRIVKAKLADNFNGATSGCVAWHEKHLYLGCSNASIEVLELKPSGKRQMLASEFVAGNAILRAGEAVWS
ncbi:methionyl-tRNA formyltransferase [Adlercreutzia sp. ZJ154]|uniref:methionyl-tRNA formyltransferase n=1 Tax=Adlercreutzia sp. ZJ154 TaxID=2709790 RepID=UPI0013ED5CDF|nr:methionyl-tRNA formyltransferase [Adlercreutzia sp. ZJ154]